MTVAFVFPGQGSQSVDMLNDVKTEFSVVKKLFDQASELLNYDLSEIVFQGPPQKLNQTIYTQPALLVADFAMWQVWRQQGGQEPVVMAGHSLGEYAALAAAEVITFADAVKIVAQRAEFMQQAVPEGEGAMAVIVLLDMKELRQICQQAAQHEIVSIANINEAKQMVIAGHSAAVDRAVALAKEAGAKLAKRLAVSVPSHCALMKPAAEQLAQCLEKIDVQSGKIPVINNVDAIVHTEPQAIRNALVKQVYQPVRWVQTIENMVQQGVTKIIECGPGKVLAGQNRRICKHIESLSLNSIVTLNQLLTIGGK